MSVVVPITSIADVLFEHSQDIPNDIYIELMNSLKHYHEHENNTPQIKQLISKLDKTIQSKLQKYFKPQSIITFSLCVKVCIVTLAVVVIMGTIMYFQLKPH